MRSPFLLVSILVLISFFPLEIVLTFLYRGRPSSSHYFIGAQGSNLFYLDPHTTRPFLPYHSSLSEYTPQEIESCHTKRLRRIHLREMDPSMLLAFLIKDENDWNDWRQKFKEVMLSEYPQLSELILRIISPSICSSNINQAAISLIFFNLFRFKESPSYTLPTINQEQVSAAAQEKVLSMTWKRLVTLKTKKKRKKRPRPRVRDNQKTKRMKQKLLWQ